MLSLRIVVGSTAAMSACALGKVEAQALLQVTASKHIQNVIQKMDTLKIKEDVSLQDMKEQIDEFKDHIASVLQEPSNVSAADIKLLTDLIAQLDTIFLAELARQKVNDVARYNTKLSQHVKCTTYKDKRMSNTSGKVTQDLILASQKREKHKGCRKAQRSWELFKSDAEKVGVATFGNAVGILDSTAVSEIDTLCTQKDQWDTDSSVYKNLPTVNDVAMCATEQKAFEDTMCTVLTAKASTCIAYDECIEAINLTSEKSATEAECTNRMDVEVVLAKTKCHLVHLSKVFNNENSTNVCDDMTVDDSSLACSLQAVPAVSPCSSEADITSPTLPSPTESDCLAWIAAEYSFDASYKQVATCRIEEPCVLPTQIGTHDYSDGCANFADVCDFYDRHQDACSHYPEDDAATHCCACGGGIPTTTTTTTATTTTTTATTTTATATTATTTTATTTTTTATTTTTTATTTTATITTTTATTTTATTTTAAPWSQWSEIAQGKFCSPITSANGNWKWLGVYGDPGLCVETILGRADCSQYYFNHATDGDRNCGCVIPGVDCTDTSKQTANAIIRTYRIEAPTPTWSEIAQGKFCSPVTVNGNWKWLGVSGDPGLCVETILGRADCSQSYFNHATGGDRSCSCVIPGVDCTDTSKQTANTEARIYRIEAPDLWTAALIEAPDSVATASCPVCASPPVWEKKIITGEWTKAYEDGCNDMDVSNDKVPDDAKMIRVTMGNVVDYYMPSGTNTVRMMLSSRDRHLFSYDGLWWTEPARYYNHVGGSASFWPCSCGASFDDRKHVSFYGGHSNGKCGCCSNDYSTSVQLDWGKDFSLEYLK